MNDLTLYEKYRFELKTGDALLYKSVGSPIGWLIRKFSKDFNHAGLVLRFDQYMGKECRVWTIEAASPRVCLNVVSDKLQRYHGEVWWYPLKDEFDDRRDLVGEYALLKDGTPYDFGSLFKNIAGRVSVNADSLFCSELNFMAWRYAGIVKGEMAPRPGDIPSLGIFKEPIMIITGQPAEIETITYSDPLGQMPVGM